MGCGGSTHPRVMRREDYPARKLPSTSRLLKLIDKAIDKDNKKDLEGSYWWKRVVAMDIGAVAFEVPLEEGEESLVKKHPPKRLQRLEDQQSPNITAKDIESKLAEAEQRRLQILNQRIQSAKAAVKAVKKPSKPEE